MNDIGSSNNKKESVFKVYKDKLTDFTGQKKPADQTGSIPATPSQTESLNDLNKPQAPSQANLNLSAPIQDLGSPTQNINSDHLPQEEKPSMAEKTKQIFSGGTSSLIFKSLLIILITLLIGYLVVNYQAIALKINYYYQVNIKHLKWSDLHPVTLQKATSTSQKLDENYLYIPTLGIQAPVIWGVEEKDINNALSSGLVNYLASATPDNATGYVYITGNTSGPIWSKGPYKTTFTLLNKIQSDNVITIIYKNKIYSYKVTATESVSNNSVVVSPGEDVDGSVLILLARYPIGINWSTYKVTAKLYKIESNIIESIEDKIDTLPETYVPTEKPIEVKPTTTAVPIPTANNINNPDLSPDHFLPAV